MMNRTFSHRNQDSFDSSFPQQQQVQPSLNGQPSFSWSAQQQQLQQQQQQLQQLQQQLRQMQQQDELAADSLEPSRCFGPSGAAHGSHKHGKSSSDVLESLANAVWFQDAGDVYSTLQQQQQQQQQQLEPVAGDINPVAWDPAQGGDFEENLSAGEQLDNENRFRHYQADQWTTMLEELIQFKRVNGHCNVPHTSKTLPALGRWVKRQRYQYKLMQEGKRESTMTPERAQVLEQVGFVWDAHSSTWVRRYQELQAYYEENGHTNVPSNYPRNPQLSTWCKFQRRQYKNLQRGGNGAGGGREPTGNSLTPARIQALEDIGFQWQLRRNRTRNTSTNV